MDFVIEVDWWNYPSKDWINEGRRVMRETTKKELSADAQEPMMNYAYPLISVPHDSSIKKVCEKTSLTVMSNETGYYLALTGGGMDFSQDIALAYLMLDEPIPFELALNISTQKGLTVHGKNFEKIMKACKNSLKTHFKQAKSKFEKIDKALNQRR